MIPYGCQSISQDDIDSVVKTLQSTLITQGPQVEEFEAAICQATQAHHAVAVCNATSALQLCCLAVGLGSGDYLWTSPITFVASANCGLQCGAKVDFVDIDPATGNICPNALEAKLITAHEKGTLPKVVIPVHLAGQPCDMESIHRLSKQYGFYIIEDASHAIGATYHEKPVGCSQFSDMTVFSFHPVKIITTGEGGAITTNSKEFVKKLKMLRAHGITKERQSFKGDIDAPWAYEQQALGINARITDIQAALGTSQLKRLQEFIAQRTVLAKKYSSEIKQHPILDYLPPEKNRTSSWHLFIVKVPAILRRALYGHMVQAGIGVNVHYIPVHLQPYYQQLGFKPGDFPQAESFYSQILTIPLFPSMTQEQQDRVIRELLRGVDMLTKRSRN